MKTAELTGAALDWAVAKCEGYETRNNYEVSYCDVDGDVFLFQCMADDGEHAIEQCANAYTDANSFDAVRLDPYMPSTDWAQGGPIIERESIELQPRGTVWKALILPREPHDKGTAQQGATPLIAAMRAYVASKLGDEVEVPNELAE